MKNANSKANTPHYNLPIIQSMDIGWTSFIRIAAWTLLLLVLAYQCSPKARDMLPEEAQKMAQSNVELMTISSETSGWFRRDFTDFSTLNEGKNIAWIAGSSVNVIGRNISGKQVITPLPVLVTQSLSIDNDKGPRIFFYSQSARRLLDTYTMVKDALSRNPDYLILTLNPFWEYNNKAIYNRENVFYAGADLWWNQDDWPWLMSLVPPRFHFWNTLGKNTPQAISGQSYAQLSSELSDKYFSAKPSVPTRDNQALRFWLAHNSSFSSETFQYGKKSVLRWQYSVFEVSDTEEETLGREVMEKMLNLIRDSGVPSFVYLAPVSPKLKKKDLAYAGYTDVHHQIQQLVASYSSDQLELLADLPTPVTSGLVFNDLLHLKRAGPLTDFVAEKIRHRMKLQ